jgi:XTP/dITP diphosphohydrolase
MHGSLHHRTIGESLVVASHNAGKVREINALLAPFAIAVHSAAELHVPEPEETGLTFEENAALKARAAALASGMDALADDSGMAVDALDGAPGIYSARWAGESKDFAAAMRRVESELRAAGVEPNGAAASFVCVLALSDKHGNVQCFRGEVLGTLTFPPRGENGFGYDPIFIAEGYSLTFGEMAPDEKHAMSHRAKAFAQLVDQLKKE